jgi:hypothetical protein
VRGLFLVRQPLPPKVVQYIYLHVTSFWRAEHQARENAKPVAPQWARSDQRLAPTTNRKRPGSANSEQLTLDDPTLKEGTHRAWGRLSN